MTVIVQTLIVWVDTMQSCRQTLMFMRNVLLPSAGSSLLYRHVANKMATETQGQGQEKESDQGQWEK